MNASTIAVQALTPSLRRETAGRVAVALGTIGGGALLIAGVLLPWLSVYAGLTSFRGIAGINGQLLLGIGVMAIVAGIAFAWWPSPLMRWSIAGLGFAGSSLGAWVLSQLIAGFRQLQADSFLVPSLGPGAFVALTGGLLLVATLLVPLESRTLPDGAAPAVANDGRSVLRTAAVALLIGAALVHFAVIGPHIQESVLYAAFFVGAGVAQLLAALALATRPEPRTLIAIALGNALVIAVWVVSRTTGLPFGPTPGVPESVSVPDVIAGVEEALLVAAVAALAVRDGRSISVSRWAALAGTVIVTAGVAVATVAAMVVTFNGGS